MTQNPQPSTPPASRQPVRLDRRRYWRVVVFFGGVILNILWWEMILRRVVGRRAVARGRSARLQHYAIDFRRVAVRLGGVMIKLGQFFSARVDVMPPEIIDALADLQDEVPPEALDKILPVIEAELGIPARDLFSEFNTQVRAAASLGQVYGAQLQTGERVVIKVLRPGIEQIVATDLAALGVVARAAMRWEPIRSRADVPRLLEEFGRTLWEELDYRAEAGNAERFRELFAGDQGVIIPAIFREVSADRVLTLEDVASIKITDYAAIDAAGIDRKQVADRLLDVYLRMIFDFGFFHADPHPGNLFVLPLARPDSENDAARAAAEAGTPFRIVFVDFGMVGHVTDRVKDGLREMLIAVATRDSKRVLAAYKLLGVLLPSADLSRIEQAQTEALDYAWGKSTTELVRMSGRDKREFALKYRDLMYNMPFQVPQDFIYLARALGILSGMCTGLDKEFSLWEPVAKYAQKLVAKEARRSTEFWLKEALALGQAALALPRQAHDVLTRLQQGRVELQTSPTEALQADLRRLETAITGVTRALVFASLLITGTWLYTSGQTGLGLVGFGLAGLAWLVMALRRNR
jgi:predicted unusual protein kinase regulating ubiquinone biosynthesis (AarF/ABC1/UbiB family)